MSHLKRQKIPKNWPIARKGTKYVVRPNSHTRGGIPLLIVIRDMLKIAQNKKEVKKAIHEKNILLNTKPATDEKASVLLFDTITIVPSKESYKLSLSEKGKFVIEKITEAESERKISKIIDKKILKGKKIQLNLSDGRNFLSDLGCKVNDSVVVDLKNKKISKCIPMAEKANASIFGGKHAGKSGTITEVSLENKMAKLKTSEEEFNVLIKQLIVVE